MKPKEILTKGIPLWIMIIGFIVTSLGGWFSGQLRTEKRLNEILVVQSKQDLRITYNKESNEKTLKALEQTSETLKNFIIVYAAKSGIVIEWSRSK